MNELANENGSDPDASRCDLGVLFVHGIGQPVRGDTLVHFGDPLCEWITKWVSAKSTQANESQPPRKGQSDEVQFERLEAFIRQRSDEPEAPPQVKLYLKRTSNAKTVKHTWLLAESWWPQSFITPRYRDLAWWGLLILPGITASHCGAQGYRWWKKLLSFLSGLTIHIPLVIAGVLYFPVAILSFFVLTIGYITISLVVVCLLSLVILLILILAILPVPRLRSVLLSVQQRLVGTVGDSYVFVTSPIQETAIISRLVRDIRWMIGRCDRLAIVAHSQGAAITHLALRTGVLHDFDAQRALLVTFGSGLKKLESLRRNSERIALSGWLATVGIFLTLICLYIIAFTNIFHILLEKAHSDNDFTNRIAGLPVAVVIGGLVIGLALWLIVGISLVRVQNLETDDLDPGKRFGVKLSWFDYFASMDPVPNGPLFDKDKIPEYLRNRSIEVHNYSAPWSDHTTYWKNIDGFVSQAARVITRFADFPLLDPQSDDDERLSLSMHRRRWRVGWLIAARVFACMTAVGLLIGNKTGLISIGSEISAILAADWNVALVPHIQTFLPLTIPATEGLIGGVGVVLLVLLGYFMLYLAWCSWNKVDIEAIFARSEYKLWPFWFFVYLAVFLLDFTFFGRLGWLTALEKVNGELFSLAFWGPPFIVVCVVILWGFLVAIRRPSSRIFERITEATNDGLTAGERNLPPVILIALLTAPIAGWGVFGQKYSDPMLISTLVVADLVFIWYYNARLRDMLEKVACLGEPAGALRKLSS